MERIKFLHIRLSLWLGLQPLFPLLLLSFGLYLQHIEGLTPCPMCIVQRYALVIVMVCFLAAAASQRALWQSMFNLVSLLFSFVGAYVAARQSWLQWYPPETVSCGRDFYGIIETFPLQRALPMIFRGSGDCSQVDWTFLGGSIANWSFVAFLMLAFISLLTLKMIKTATYANRVTTD